MIRLELGLGRDVDKDGERGGRGMEDGEGWRIREKHGGMEGQGEAWRDKEVWLGQ